MLSCANSIVFDRKERTKLNKEKTHKDEKLYFEFFITLLISKAFIRMSSVNGKSAFLLFVVVHLRNDILFVPM